MKTYKKIILSILLVAGIVTAGAVSPKIAYRMVTGNYLVAASNSSSLAKLVAYKVCDGTADEVQWQACVAAAEATGKPSVVKVASGGYSFANTVYIGYANDLVEGTEGCSLVCEGKVEITWTGSTVGDCGHGKWMIQVAPSLFNINFRLQGLTLKCENKVNGVFTHKLIRGTVKDLQIQRPRYIGLLANNSWFSHYEQISITTAEGMGAIFLRCNTALIERVTLYNSNVSNMPAVFNYNWSASSASTSTFEPLEVLTEEDGGEQAIFLGYGAQPNDTASGRMVVAYLDESSPDEFDNGKEVEGGTSGGTATVRITANHEGYNCNSGIYITCQQFLLQDIGLENLNYVDKPLLLIMANTGRVSNVYFEQSTTFPTGSPNKPAEILIKLNECRNVVVENVYGHAGNTYLVPANAYDCDVDQGTQTISSMVPTTFGSRLVTDDEVYIWDGVGGITDGVYVVDTVAGDNLSFTVDEDPGDDSGADAAFVYAITNVTRMSPATVVDMEECRGCTVRNLNYRGCRTSLVVVDADCVDCTVDTLRDFWVEEVAFVGQADDFWLNAPHPAVPVNDSGTGSQSYNLQVYDPLNFSGGSVTYSGIDDDVQVLDEVDGNTYRTTLVLHNKQMSIDGAAIGFGTEKIYDFPTGNILVLGVVVDVVIDATDQYDSGTTISDTADGDVSCGTTGTADSTLDGTDVDLAAKTDIAQLTGGTGPVDAPLVPLTPVSFNGTGGAKDAYISVLIDDADISGSTTIALRGTVTIHWVELGDY